MCVRKEGVSQVCSNKVRVFFYTALFLANPTVWEVVLSLRGDTSERHCDKGSFFVSFAFGSMRVPTQTSLFAQETFMSFRVQG